MLIISTWLWGDAYSADDVIKLRAGVSRNLREPHRFLLVTDRLLQIPGVERSLILDGELTKHRGCFARLRMFDPSWQSSIQMRPGDRLVNLDLDTVITGGLDGLFPSDRRFMILRGANAANLCPYTGCLMMLAHGAHPELWSTFSLEAASQIRKHEFADDQGWIWHKLGDGVDGWDAGKNGVYAFQKPGWPGGETLSSDARLVNFIGWRKPSKFTHVEWVRQHWRR